MNPLTLKGWRKFFFVISLFLIMGTPLWLMLGYGFCHRGEKQNSVVTQSSTVGAHYSDSGLPLMVCEYLESHQVVHHDRFTNCQPVRTIKRFETEPNTSLGQNLMYILMND